MMNDTPICRYRNVSERDMDLLFMEAFATDPGFLSLFVDKIDPLKVIEKWLHDGGHTDITLVKTNKSAAFRIMTPEIKMSRPFETWKMGDLNRCFEAIQELADLATMFGVIKRVIF